MPCVFPHDNILSPNSSTLLTLRNPWFHNNSPFLSLGDFLPRACGLRHPYTYTATLQLHHWSSSTHNSPLKLLLLTLRQKQSFSYISKLYMCHMRSHVITYFHLTPACSWFHNNGVRRLLVPPHSTTRSGSYDSYPSSFVDGKLTTCFFTPIEGEFGAGWSSYTHSGNLSWSKLPRRILSLCS